MKIDRTNYEIWFIDWLDGNLTDLQISQMNQFLDENPDLKEEFNFLDPGPTLPTVDTNCNSFRYKERLKKSADDILPSQFEYLCVASVENDLSEDQETELKEMTEKDPAKKRTFELISKTKLQPVGIAYPRKKRLLKKTATQKVIRLSAIVLSAAAILIPVLLYIIAPGKPSLKTLETIPSVSAVSNPGESSIKKVPDQQSEKSSGNHEKSTITRVNTRLIASVITDSPADSILPFTRQSEIALTKVPVNASIEFEPAVSDKTLAISKIKFVQPPVDDERSNIGRFLARTVRGKILREKASPDTPLRGYEIAQAGITELNKLLGWEMALKENNDENGNPKSVYFSSRLLKFNASVKKSGAAR